MSLLITKPTKSSLIRVFTVCSMGSYGPKLSSSGQRRLWSDLADAQADLSLHWAHMPFCWLCHEADHIFPYDYITRQECLWCRWIAEGFPQTADKNQILKKYVIKKFVFVRVGWGDGVQAQFGSYVRQAKLCLWVVRCFFLVITCFCPTLRFSAQNEWNNLDRP